MNIQRQHRLLKVGVLVAVVIIITTMLMDDTSDSTASKSPQSHGAPFRSMIVPVRNDDAQIKQVASDSGEPGYAKQPERKILVSEQTKSDVIAAEKKQAAKAQIESAAKTTVIASASQIEQKKTVIRPKNPTVLKLIEEQSKPRKRIEPRQAAVKLQPHQTTQEEATVTIKAAAKSQIFTGKEIIASKHAVKGTVASEPKPMAQKAADQQTRTLKLVQLATSPVKRSLPDVKQDEKKGAIPADLHAAKTLPAKLVPQAAKVPVNHDPLLVDKAWVVQLGSFSNIKNAIRLRDKLRKNGFMTFVEGVTTGGKRSTRVYVGPILGLPQAKLLLKKLEKNLRVKGLLVEYSL